MATHDTEVHIPSLTDDDTRQLGKLLFQRADLEDSECPVKSIVIEHMLKQRTTDVSMRERYTSVYGEHNIPANHAMKICSNDIRDLRRKSLSMVVAKRIMRIVFKMDILITVVSSHSIKRPITKKRRTKKGVTLSCF